jgi:hypothetical protein
VCIPISPRKAFGKAFYSQELTMTYQQLYDLAAKWNTKGNAITKDSPKTIEIYDVQDQTTSGKLTAEWGHRLFPISQVRWQVAYRKHRVARPEKEAKTLVDDFLDLVKDHVRSRDYNYRL